MTFFVESMLAFILPIPFAFSFLERRMKKEKFLFKFGFIHIWCLWPCLLFTSLLKFFLPGPFDERTNNGMYFHLSFFNPVVYFTCAFLHSLKYSYPEGDLFDADVPQEIRDKIVSLKILPDDDNNPVQINPRGYKMTCVTKWLFFSTILALPHFFVLVYYMLYFGPPLNRLRENRDPFLHLFLLELDMICSLVLSYICLARISFLMLETAHIFYLRYLVMEKFTKATENRDLPLDTPNQIQEWYKLRTVAQGLDKSGLRALEWVCFFLFCLGGALIGVGFFMFFEGRLEPNQHSIRLLLDVSLMGTFALIIIFCGSQFQIKQSTHLKLIKVRALEMSVELQNTPNHQIEKICLLTSSLASIDRLISILQEKDRPIRILLFSLSADMFNNIVLAIVGVSVSSLSNLINHEVHFRPK